MKRSQFCLIMGTLLLMATLSYRLQEPEYSVIKLILQVASGIYMIEFLVRLLKGEEL